MDGVTLDNFAELKTVEGLKEGSLIKVGGISNTLFTANLLINHKKRILIMKCVPAFKNLNEIGR